MRAPHRMTLWTVTVVTVLIGVSACGGKSKSSTPSGGATNASTPNGSATNTPVPHAVESNPGGDIPDNQAFVAFADPAGRFTVTVPEGWARGATGTATVFTDKYNSIRIESQLAATAPTTDSARTDELPAIQTGAPGFATGKISTVDRKAGQAVLITYQASSPLNTVTGKVATEAVERYEFWRAGREVVVTLSAPVDSDNVDPWRKVTDSFTWTR